jgi:hypothetical protein
MATQSSGYKSAQGFNFGFLAGARQLRSEEEQGTLTSKTRFLPGSLPAMFSKVFDDFGDVGEDDKTSQNAIHPNARWNTKPALGSLASIYRESNEGNVRVQPGEEITTHPHDHYDVSNVSNKMKKSLPSIAAKGKDYSKAVGNFDDNPIEFEEAFEEFEEVDEEETEVKEEVNHQDEHTADLDTSQLRVRAKTGETPASFKESKRGGVHEVKDKEGKPIASVASGKETMIDSLKTGEVREVQHSKATVAEADKLPMSQMEWADDTKESQKQMAQVEAATGMSFQEISQITFMATPAMALTKEPATQALMKAVAKFLIRADVASTEINTYIKDEDVDKVPTETIVAILERIKAFVSKGSNIKQTRVKTKVEASVSKRKVKA